MVKGEIAAIKEAGKVEVEGYIFFSLFYTFALFQAALIF